MMKIKKDFMLRTVGGQHMVVATGITSRTFNGMLRLNEVGAFLWDRLTVGAEKEDLVNALLGEYAVDTTTATADVEAFLKQLGEVGVFE